MLVLRMIRNALSTLMLLLTLGILAVRLAPFYLPPEQARAFDAFLRDGILRAAQGRDLPLGMTVGQGVPGGGDVVGDSQAALQRDLERVREELRQAGSGAPPSAPAPQMRLPQIGEGYSPPVAQRKVVRVGE